MGRKWIETEPGAQVDSEARPRPRPRSDDSRRPSDATPAGPAQMFDGRTLPEAQQGRQASDGRISTFAARLKCAGPDGARVRRLLQPDIPVRIWHRVYPYLPKEHLADGSLIVWHPGDDGWTRAIDCVHANRAILWRCSGASLMPAGAMRPVLHDFRALDTLDLADWSALVPDPRFREFIARADLQCRTLAEFVARWACELGPQEAGVVLGPLMALGAEG